MYLTFQGNNLFANSSLSLILLCLLYSYVCIMISLQNGKLVGRFFLHTLDVQVFLVIVGNELAVLHSKVCFCALLLP